MPLLLENRHIRDIGSKHLLIVSPIFFSWHEQREYRIGVSQQSAELCACLRVATSGAIQEYDKSAQSSAGALILASEARLDKDGKLSVYTPPSGDGGGAYEVGGINARYHPKKAAELKGLIENGRHDEARASAAQYIQEYTEPAANMLKGASAGEEYILRDMYFNSGRVGAQKVLSEAIKRGGDRLHALKIERDALYRGIARNNPEKQKFLKGWLSRSNKVYNNAKKIL